MIRDVDENDIMQCLASIKYVGRVDCTECVMDRIRGDEFSKYKTFLYQRVVSQVLSAAACLLLLIGVGMGWSQIKENQLRSVDCMLQEYYEYGAYYGTSISSEDEVTNTYTQYLTTYIL